MGHKVCVATIQLCYYLRISHGQDIKQGVLLDSSKSSFTKTCCEPDLAGTVAVNTNLESFMYLSYLSSMYAHHTDCGDNWWVYNVKINKRKPQLKLEWGRPAEGTLLLHHSSSINPQEDINYWSHQEENYLALLNRKCNYFPSPTRGRLSSCPATSSVSGKGLQPSQWKTPVA